MDIFFTLHCFSFLPLLKTSSEKPYSQRQKGQGNRNGKKYPEVFGENNG